MILFSGLFMKFCRSADMRAGTSLGSLRVREGEPAKEVSAILRNDSIKERDPSELDEVLSYFHELAFQADPRSPLPVALEGDDRALALRDVLLQVRTMLSRRHEGDLEGTIDAGGFFGVLLDMLRMDLKHVMELMDRMADGDLFPRTEPSGGLAEAFDRMAEKCSRTASRLKADEERWRIALQCSRDGVFEIFPGAWERTFCSPSMAGMQHLSLKDLPPMKRWVKYIHPEDVKARHILKDVLDGTYIKGSYDVVFRLLCADGVYRWRQSRGQIFRDAKGRITRAIGILRDIHSRKEREDDFKYRATHDVLTGLPSRSLFHQHLLQMMASAKRTGKSVLVVMADLDHFKDVNDTLGHHAGDLLLQEFAARLRSSIRTSDIAARVGGDEFALLLTCDPEPHKYAAAIQRIRASLEAPVCLEKTCYQIHASMGIAVYPQDGDELLVLLKRADNALYQAKNSGRNTYCFFTPTQHQSS